MITREQVENLRPGDVVELRLSGLNVTIRGPLERLFDGLGIAGWPVRTAFGDPVDQPHDRKLTVVFRVPRAYVNHSRPTFFRGDVVRVESAEPEDGYVDVYAPRSEHDPVPWVSLGPADFLERYSTEDAMPSASGSQRAVLLVDGETGQVVPS